jgi:hypothetical protein
MGFVDCADNWNVLKINNETTPTKQLLATKGRLMKNPGKIIADSKINAASGQSKTGKKFLQLFAMSYFRWFLRGTRNLHSGLAYDTLANHPHLRPRNAFLLTSNF